MPVSQSKILLLDLIEVVVRVFRGPNEETWSELAHTALPDLLDRVQAFPGFPAEPLRGLAEALSAHDRAGDFSPLESEYVRLFIAGPGGVPAPLYESCHLGTATRTMGDSALAMRDRLAEAGLAVSLPSNEPPDHLSLELEYLYSLCAEGWEDEPAMALHGANFARKVMLPWVARFREALAGAEPDPVFLHAADLTLAVLRSVAGV